MEKDNEKRVLRVELDDDVKKVSITAKDGDEKVIMRQELSEDELDNVAGGVDLPTPQPPIGHTGVWFPPGWHKPTDSQKP